MVANIFMLGAVIELITRAVSTSSRRSWRQRPQEVRRAHHIKALEAGHATGKRTKPKQPRPSR